MRIYCPDIECDSCVKILDKKIGSLQGIESVKVNKDSLDVEFDKSLIKEESIIGAIKKSGFRASTEPFDRKTWKERKRHFKENKDHYKLEIDAIKYAIYAFLVLTAIEAIAYVGIFSSIPGFLAKYGWWLFYLNISIAALGSAMWHVLAHDARVTCMVGMMIGMTIGMQSGMMIGAVFGATNGFFIGSMVGMLLGSYVGTITGKCCGVMGIMEGMMAGVMGGTMGPMISVMMFTDHLLVFMPFYMAINLMIIAGLTYMMLEEVGESESVKKKPADLASFISIVTIVTIVLVAIMVYGPKSPLVAYG